MPWVKDLVSQAPKIVYIAPADLLPMTKIIYNPKPKAGETAWTVQYAYLNTPTSSLLDVERLMGLL
jgi:hypothetical protein